MSKELQLYKWQKDTIELCENRHHLAILAEIGTGKTCTAIHIIRQKMNAEKKLLKVLILGPVAVLYNWQNEIQKFSKIPEESTHVSTGSGAARAKKLAAFLKDEKGVVVINYEALRNKDIMLSLFNWKPDMLICDESHMLKNPQAQQSKLVSHLADVARYRFIMTGTPILNSPMDVFMQYRILDKGNTFGKNFFAFRGMYFYDANANKRSNMTNYFPMWIPRKDMFEDLSEKMYRSAIRVKKEECMDLPPLIKQDYYVELSSQQKRLYLQMKRDFITYIEDNKGKKKAVVAQLALTKALRLQQIVSGFVQDDEGKIIDLGEIPRLKAVKDIVEQIKDAHKFILWCSFVHNYRQLEKLLDSMGIKYVLITGEQTTKQKQESIDAFEKSEDVRAVIANRRAGGVGINLIQASYSIVYSRNFSLADEVQSEGRNYRGGSQIHEKIVKITLCAKETLDERVNTALNNKQEISDRIVDLVIES